MRDGGKVFILLLKVSIGVGRPLHDYSVCQSIVLSGDFLVLNQLHGMVDTCVRLGYEDVVELVGGLHSVAEGERVFKVFAVPESFSYHFWSLAQFFRFRGSRE